MLQKLKHRWKVNTINLVLIIATFAIGGSLCGRTGAYLLNLTGLEKNITWWLLYVIAVTILWPFFVLVISIPLGQFSFFKNYLKKVGRSLSGKKMNKINVAIFASGAGSNAQKIIDHFRNDADVNIALIVCNKAGAGVLVIAEEEGIPSLLINKNKFEQDGSYARVLQELRIDFIVLAGFLWKIPLPLIKAYPNRIINIHPALLPKYGGKGMYGQHVHEAVIQANEKESGITIHYVDEQYDHGNTILQAICPVEVTDTAATLAGKVHQLEHLHYPVVIANLLQKLK